jgi:predicted dienelactone hydrolase
MSSSKLASEMTRAEKALAVTGLPIGPYPIGVKTVQIDGDPERGRGLQTEFWYPSTDASAEMPTTKYSEYLGLDNCADPKAALDAANAGNAIGGYRDGISIEELDDPSRSTWMTNAVRNAPVRDCGDTKWPLVVFSHGSGAYRASYSFWTEFLASHGFVVAACDHPGSARYTIVDGKVVTPISNRAKNEANRPLDILQILDGVESASKDDDLFQKTDASNAAVTGMSFGGFTTAATLEFQDPRLKAAVMMSGSMGKSGTQDYHTPARKNKSTPVLIMLGTEDTVLGDAANEANREYGKHHTNGDVYLLEIVRGGHVSFTSCEMYDPEYGNGINANGKSKSLTNPGGLYEPLPIQTQHEVANSYGLKFLNKYLKQTDDEGYLKKNHFDEKEFIYKSFAKD